MKYVEKRGIQTRPIFSGNITYQPAFQMRQQKFPVADQIMKTGFLIGCHQSLTSEELKYVKEIFNDFLEEMEYKYGKDFSPEDWNNPGQ